MSLIAGLVTPNKTPEGRKTKCKGRLPAWCPPVPPLGFVYTLRLPPHCSRLCSLCVHSGRLCGFLCSTPFSYVKDSASYITFPSSCSWKEKEVRLQIVSESGVLVTPGSCLDAELLMHVPQCGERGPPLAGSESLSQTPCFPETQLKS